MCRLAGAEDGAVHYLGKRIQVPAPIGQKKVLALIADLDNDGFSVREAATRQLEALGYEAVADCRKALESQPSPEKRERLTAILDKQFRHTLTPDQLRGVRGVEVLERIGTPRARDALAVIAKGNPGVLTIDAQASLERLGSLQKRR